MPVRHHLGHGYDRVGTADSSVDDQRLLLAA